MTRLENQAKYIIFYLPNARPVECRSVTLLAHSLSFCSYWGTHTHTHTHTQTHTHNTHMHTQMHICLTFTYLQMLSMQKSSRCYDEHDSEMF